MDILKNIISQKDMLLIFPGDDGSIAYLNNYFRDIGKTIQRAVYIKPEDKDKQYYAGCTSLHISELSHFDIDKIAIFVFKAANNYEIERQLRRYSLVHNHNYFYIEDFAIYPIRENYSRISVHAPWSMDSAFIDIHNKVQSHTRLDIYRCYELKSLLEQVLHLDGNVLEVGVRHGGSGFLLASYTAQANKKVFLADTFCGFVNVDHNFDRGVTDFTRKDYSSYAKNLFAGSQLTNYEFLVGSFPEDTAHHIEHEKFCFCHIDTDVYWAVRNPTEWIWERLCIGGIIVYDDYGFVRWDGATRFVDEISHMKDRIFIYNLNGHGIIIKTA